MYLLSKIRNWKHAALPALALLAILAAAAGFRAFRLGGECFDGDELYAVRIHGLSFRNIALVMARDSFHTNHPFLMTVPYLLWEAAFGIGETGVRSLPMLLGVATVALVFALGSELAGKRVGLIAAAVLALNPLHIAYSQEARQYAMLVFLVTAAHWTFVRALHGGGRVNLLVYFTAVLLAVFTHYFAVPALAPHGVVALWLLIRGDADCRQAAAGVFLTLVAAVIPFLAWLPVLVYQSGVVWPHLRDASLGSLGDCLAEVAGVGGGGRLFALVGAAAFLLVGGFGFLRTRQGLVRPPAVNSRGPLPHWAAGLLCCACVAVAAVAAWAGPACLVGPATETLRTYGYDTATVAAEVRLVCFEVAALPAALAVSGALLFAWDWPFRLLSRPAATGGSAQPLGAGGFVFALFAVPLIAVELMSLRGVPFLSSRNLLILAPVVALAIGLGVSVLLRSWPGALAAAAGLAVLAVCIFQYEPVALPLGYSGVRLGMHTGPWNRVAADIGTDPRPMVSGRHGSGPMPYYVTGRPTVWLDSADELPAKVAAPEFLYVEVEDDPKSVKLSGEMRDAGIRLTPLCREQTLSVFVARRGDQP